jgi:hypothetical protein
MHLVAKAALRALTTWIQSGKAPVTAPRISVAPGPTPQIRRDPDGIALGGIRTPPVDVPVAALSGVPGPHPSTICLLLGSTRPFSAMQLAQRYPSRSAYLQRYDADTDMTIRDGFVLPEDRAALLGLPIRPPSGADWLPPPSEDGADRRQRPVTGPRRGSSSAAISPSAASGSSSALAEW